MAYETKVILALLAKHLIKCETVEEAYEAIVSAANVEGLELPSYNDAINKLKNMK